MMSSSRAMATLRRHCFQRKKLLAFERSSAFSTAILPWQDRPKMVILGAGWAAINLIRNLDETVLKQYNILVCAPVNHFVNTPLLPSVTVGTLGPRAIVEPIRNFIVKHRNNVPEAHIKFNEVEALQVDTESKRIQLQTRGREGRSDFQAVVQSMPSATVESKYWINYDVLVCAVGATSNTFGTPGALEYCTFLKTVQDAMKIRTTLLDCFETAASFGTPDGEIDRLLQFVVIGAGPTGVEVAAEIHDFVQEDVLPRYSNFATRNVSVKIVEMSPKMLGTYDKLISQYCADRFKKLEIEMLTEHRVTKVNPTSVEALDLKTGEKKIFPFGLCVWASGVKPNPVSLQLAKDFQGSRMLEVDGNLRLRGAEGSIFAMGDCAKITQPSMKANAKALFEKADINKDGYLSQKEFEAMIETSRKDFPHLESFLGEAAKGSIASMYKDMDSVETKTPGVTVEVFENALADVDKQMKMLPPTAQVAMQQGEYLAKILNNVKYENLANEGGFEPAFEYDHAGSMAYIGGEHAVLDSPVFGKQAGILTYAMWKGVYWGRSTSLNSKVNLVFDWARSWFLGRDTSRF